jgi:hypothetical protein
LMMVANFWPSWSRATRLATGVFALKNVVQLVAIWAAAADPLPGDAEAGADADDAGAEVAPEPELFPLLEQAATPAASAHASTICWIFRGATILLIPTSRLVNPDSWCF